MQSGLHEGTGAAQSKPETAPKPGKGRVWPRVRRLIYQAHLWVAVILVSVLAPLGLTGVVLAWPDQINAPYRASPPVPASETPKLPPSVYLAQARAALPEPARLQGVRLPAGPGEAVVVAANTGAPGPAGGRTIWLDPSDGHVLKVAPSVSPVFAWSHDFHGAFMVPGLGRSLVGWAGVAMLLLSLSGICLWWPRSAAFLRGFRWRRTPDTLLNLHHLTGFWISVPLMVLSVTGILISFPALATTVFGPTPPRPAPAEDGGAHSGHGRGSGRAAKITPEQAVAAAMAAHPDAPRLVAITLPGAGRGPASSRHAWRVDLAGAGRPVSVLVDDRSGTLSDTPAPKRPDDARRLNRQVHEGGGSLIWKVIVTLAGVAPTLLGLTGLAAWVRTGLRRARVRRTLAVS